MAGSNNSSGVSTPDSGSDNSSAWEDITSITHEETATGGASSPTASSSSEGEFLLSDVNAALRNIVSEQEAADHPAGQSVTLSEPQVTALRKLSLRVQNHKKALRKVMTGNENTRVRDHYAKDKVAHAVKKRVRRAVTGSSERKVRDWAKEAKVVKAVDKFSFGLGVTVLMATEYMCLQHPDQFGMYYVGMISAMMALRFYMYAKSRYLYFLLDFCYFANAACFLSVLVYPENARLWRLNFAVSNGTLLGALLAWRNSLVFHSLDKVTSICIHFLPGLLTYLERWFNDSHASAMNQVDAGLGWRGAFFEPLVFYLVWQLLYIFKTEIVDRKSLAADPSIQTSLRWLTRDTKNPMHVTAKIVCRAIGILGPNEVFQPEELKTKMVFWVGQLVFILFTLLPTPFLFRYRDLNTAYILLVLLAAIYNGSNYYFEVFAARYLAQLEAKAAKQTTDIPSQHAVPNEDVRVGKKEE